MSPEERIQKLEAMVADLMVWKAARIRQQLTAPLDDISKKAVGGVDVIGGGNAATHNITIGAVPATITVPAQPSGTIIMQTPIGLKEVLVK